MDAQSSPTVPPSDDADPSALVAVVSDDDDEGPVSLGERPPMDDEMDITPMIDMTFLLLIFFVLTSKMTAEQSYEVPPAKHGSSIAAKNCVVITVTRGIGDNPIVAKGDGSSFRMTQSNRLLRLPSTSSSRWRRAGRQKCSSERKETSRPSSSRKSSSRLVKCSGTWKAR